MFENNEKKPSIHESHETLLDKEWLKSCENLILKGLNQNKPVLQLLQELPGFKDIFKHKLDCLDCSDGRVCSGNKMGLAGQGILLNPTDLAILEKRIQELGIRVTGHDNCGAAGIAYPGPESDSHGYQFTKDLAMRTNASYSEVHYEDFSCPVHNERCLVLEGTGRFNVANLDGFPGRFISSAHFFGLSLDYQKKEAKALIGIALGDHGFSHRFTEDQPFYLIISAKDEADLTNIKTWADEIASDYNGLVKVNGFVAPL